jgi:phosphonate transport system ATP-binding protein
VDEPLSALDPTRARQAVAPLVQQARARGVTLVATLHQVDVALAHFPRIVGLRDGRWPSTCRPARSRASAGRLYASTKTNCGRAPDPTDRRRPRAPAPVVMHCR